MNWRWASTVWATPLKLFGLRHSIDSTEDIRLISFAENLSIIALTMSDGTCELPKNTNNHVSRLEKKNVMPSKAKLQNRANKIMQRKVKNIETVSENIKQRKQQSTGDFSYGVEYFLWAFLWLREADDREDATCGWNLRRISSLSQSLIKKILRSNSSRN